MLLLQDFVFKTSDWAHHRYSENINSVKLNRNIIDGKYVRSILYTKTKCKLKYSHSINGLQSMLACKSVFLLILF